jgi:hypothetical protein
MFSYTYLLNTNSSVSSDPPPPCYDDDNNEHACGEDDRSTLYYFISVTGLGVIIGVSCCAYSAYKHYYSGVDPLQEPLIGCDTEIV